MRAGTDSLVELLQLLYAAPGTVHGWRTFLESLRVTLDGSAANLISHNRASRSSSFGANAGSATEGLQLYEQHWGALDPWASSPRLRPEEGAVFVGDELIAHSDLTRTAFHNEFGRHFDIVRVIGTTVESDPNGLSVLTINGSEHRQPFGGPEHSLLTGLVPHLQQALRLHRRLVTADGDVAALSSVVDRMKCGQVLLDRSGCVVHVNAAASAILGARDGLAVERGELRAHDPASTRRLRQMLSAALTMWSDGNARAGGLLSVGRPSGRRSYSVLVCPLSPAHRPLLEARGAVVCVSIADPEATGAPDGTTLQTLFGLTPAEARLALLLADGVSLADAGDRLGLTRETVRSRLKSLFHKTSTHRQAEFIRVVLAASPL